MSERERAFAMPVLRDANAAASREVRVLVRLLPKRPLEFAVFGIMLRLPDRKHDADLDTAVRAAMLRAHDLLAGLVHRLPADFAVGALVAVPCGVEARCGWS